MPSPHSVTAEPWAAAPGLGLLGYRQRAAAAAESSLLSPAAAQFVPRGAKQSPSEAGAQRCHQDAGARVMERVTPGWWSRVAPRAKHRVPLFPQKVSPCVALARGRRAAVAGVSLCGDLSAPPLLAWPKWAHRGSPGTCCPPTSALCAPSQRGVRAMLCQVEPCWALPSSNTRQDCAVPNWAVPCHIKLGQAMLCHARWGCVMSCWTVLGIHMADLGWTTLSQECWSHPVPCCASFWPCHAGLY